MKEQDHEVFFCSTIVSDGYEHSAKDKYRWISKHFGDEWLTKIILTNDKTIITADYLIDDKPKITGSRDPYWKHIYFTQPYNKDLEGYRINSWLNWREVINLIESEIK